MLINHAWSFILGAKNNKHMKNLTRKKKIIKYRPWLCKIICSENYNHLIWYHLSKCLDDAIVASVKLCLASRFYNNLEQDCLLYYTQSLGAIFTKLSELLEQLFMVFVTLLLICMCKMTTMLVNVTLRYYVMSFYVSLCQLHLATKLSDHNNSLSTNVECIEAVTHHVQQILSAEMFRSIGKDQAKKELDKNLHENNHENSGLLSSSDQAFASSKVIAKHLPPALENRSKQDLSLQTSGYVTNELPGATASLDLRYETNFDKGTPPLSLEEARKNVRPVPKEKDVDSLLQSYQMTPTAVGNRTKQHYVKSKTKAAAKTVPSSIASVKSHRLLPRRACLVYHNEQYHLDIKLLSQPKATKYLLKVRTEISPGRYMARLELQCSSRDDRLPNLDATQAGPDTAENNEEFVPTGERKHFPSNISKTGYVIFSSNLGCFSGSIQYPLPTKKAVASRIGYGGNAIVFVVFHAGKEFAVKKTVYRSKEINVHSQLCHPNIINLEAVLIGEKHERHRDKHYVYCFMPKMDINFRNVLSTKEHGCLKHMKMQLLEKREQWQVVLVNVKHVLKSVLKALDYMHSQGLVHRDIKASNILVKMTCQCSEVLYCNCKRRKFLVQIGDFDSSVTVPGYQLQLEEHQMIRYASVLPLGTMGYRAPEVSMHLVLSGPYEVLYTTGVDIWSFGCLLLSIFIGKSGPLRQRGEASLLLSVQDQPYSQDLYQSVIKIKEVQKYYANTPGVCDLVHKCLQVTLACQFKELETLIHVQILGILEIRFWNIRNRLKPIHILSSYDSSITNN